MGNVTIRRVGPQDAGVLASLIRGFRDHLAASIPTDAELQHHLPNALDDREIEFWCAWLFEEAVGYTQIRFLTSIWAPGIEAHLEDLFVVASARGNAVGRALLRHALARARSRGARRFSLNTNEGNGVAQSLYRSEGLSPQSHPSIPAAGRCFGFETFTPPDTSLHLLARASTGSTRFSPRNPGSLAARPQVSGHSV